LRAIQAQLRELDPDRLTPLEALSTLVSWRALLERDRDSAEPDPDEPGS
jgi:hypothetical protein